MKFLTLALWLAFGLLPSCGELVDLETWPSNRTFDEQGGTVALDRVSLTVTKGVVPAGTNVRIVETDPSEAPDGALAEAYTVIASDTLDFKKAELAYRLDMEELPDGVYYVQVVLAVASDGTWKALPSIQDPISGEIRTWVNSPGTYSVIPVTQ